MLVVPMRPTAITSPSAITLKYAKGTPSSVANTEIMVGQGMRNAQTFGLVDDVRGTNSRAINRHMQTPPNTYATNGAAGGKRCSRSSGRNWWGKATPVGLHRIFGGTLTTNFGQACMLYVRNLESCSRFMVGNKRPAILTGSAVGKCEVQVGAVDGEGQERDQHGHRHTARDIERAEHLGTGVLQVAATAAITAHRANVRCM